MRQTKFVLESHQGIKGLLDLKSKWKLLSTNCAENFVHMSAWYESKLLVEPKWECSFISVWKDESLVAVLAFNKSIMTIKGVSFPIAVLSYGNEMGVKDIISSVDLTGYWPKIIHLLRVNFGYFVLIKSDCVLSSSHFLKSGLLNASSFLKPSHFSKYLYFPDGAETFYEAYSKKFRRDIRRKRNKAESIGNIRLETYGASDPTLQDSFERFLELEDSGWKGESGTSILKQPDKLEYYKNLLRCFTQLGSIRINLLYLGERCAAAQFSVQIHETLYLLKIAYDESFSEVSPGYLLIDEIIRNKQSVGVSKLSFVTGVTWIDRWKPSLDPAWASYRLANPLLHLFVSAAFKLKKISAPI